MVSADVAQTVRQRFGERFFCGGAIEMRQLFIYNMR